MLEEKQHELCERFEGSYDAVLELPGLAETSGIKGSETEVQTQFPGISVEYSESASDYDRNFHRVFHDVQQKYRELPAVSVYWSDAL